MTQTSPVPPATTERVQVNVRLPVGLRDEIDARRTPLGISRDEWIKRALTWAMAQPPRQRSRATVTAIGKRTVPRPR